jgi:putative ABC transport system permease protein
MSSFWPDLVHGLRYMGRHRLVTAVVIATLAIGIGGVSAVYSFVNYMLFDSVAVAAPDRVVMVWSASRAEGGSRSLASMPDFADWSRESTRLEQMSAVAGGSCTLGTQEDLASTSSCARVTASFFPLVGVPAARGRTFGAEELKPGAPPVAVISHAAWQRRFAAAPNVVGSVVAVDGRAHTIVGVMPRGFAFPSGTDVWLPQPPEAGPFDRGERSVVVMGRLRGGASLPEAQAEMSTLAQRLERDHPASNGGWGVALVSLQDESLDGQAMVVLVLLGAVVAFVLLIACGNVAHVLLAQAAARRKEFAVRAALGARPARMVGQLFLESALLAVLGGGAGLLVATALRQVLRSRFAGSLPMLNDVAVDGRVLAFTVTVSLGTALLFGLMPALAASRPNLAEDLKEGGRSPAASRRRVRDLLVVGEVGLAVVLVAVTGLMINTLVAFEHIDLGFRPERLLTFQLQAPESRYPEPAGAAGVYDDVLRQIAALPGVERAAAASRLPLAGSKRNPNRALAIEGRPVDATAGDQPWAVDVVVTPAYFDAIGIPLRGGRVFAESDGPDAPPVAVISETTARRYWPGADAVGQRLQLGGGEGASPWISVVGVVADVRNDDVDAPPVPQIYLPLAQSPRRQMSMLVRSLGDPLSAIGAVRQAMAAAGQDEAMRDIQTMEAVVRGDLESTRVLVLLLKIFAAVALILAAVGIYGVLSHSVEQRVHEIGVRMALGARPGDVLRMVIVRSLVLTLVGEAAGLVLAAFLRRGLASVLYQGGGAYLAVFAGGAAILGAVALLASLLPAWRASRVPPLVALRYE